MRDYCLGVVDEEGEGGGLGEGVRGSPCGGSGGGLSGEKERGLLGGVVVGGGLRSSWFGCVVRVGGEDFAGALLRLRRKTD